MDGIHSRLAGHAFDRTDLLYLAVLSDETPSYKNSGFKDDVAKTNAAQILKQAGIDDVKSL